MARTNQEAVTIGKSVNIKIILRKKFEHSIIKRKK